jgi:sugar lactone lactonase YvrE
MKAEQFTEVCTYHGEGPIWDSVAGQLRWVDMLNGDIMTQAPGGSISRQHVDKIAAALRPRAGGGLVVGIEHGFVLLDAGGGPGPVQTAFTDASIRMNDGGVDRQGRFFCGSMPYDQAGPRGVFYRFDPDGAITEVFGNVTISNGVAWNPAGDTMYYIDTPTHRVDVFDYDPATGMPFNRRPLVYVDPDHGAPSGAPDGMCLDAEGGLWVALLWNQEFHRIDGQGNVTHRLAFEDERAVSCVIGGPERRTLFICTSQLIDNGINKARGEGMIRCFEAPFAGAGIP